MDSTLLRSVAPFAAVALLLVGVGTALADALVETDEERLAEVIRVLEDDGPRVDRLAGYADAERVAVLVGEHGRAERVRDGGELRERLHEVLAPLDVEAPDFVQITSSVVGEEGRITLRVREDGDITNLEVTLRREGQTFVLVGARRLG